MVLCLDNCQVHLLRPVSLLPSPPPLSARRRRGGQPGPPRCLGRPLLASRGVKASPETWRSDAISLANILFQNLLKLGSRMKKCCLSAKSFGGESLVLFLMFL